MTIHLTKPMSLNGEAVSELALNFDALTGADLVAAESEARATGDNTPFIAASMRYQAAVAARMAGCPVDDILALPAADFKNIIAPVVRFLLA